MYNYYTAPNKWQYLQQQRTRQQWEENRQKIQRELEQRKMFDSYRWEPDSRISLL